MVCFLMAFAFPASGADKYADGFTHDVVGDSTDGSGSPVGAPDGSALSLGRNGVVTVTFSDNLIFDKPGVDFRITDIGPNSECYSVEASNGGGFVSVGSGCGSQDFDLAGAIDRVNALKITDNNSTDAPPDGGLDLDAVTSYNPWDLKITKVSPSFLPINANSVNVTATIDPSTAGKIKFHLIEVSTEPGHAMNFGTEAADDPDLKLEAQSGFDVPNQTTATTTSEVTSATVTVSSKDYGAYGKIEAFITQVGGQALSPQIKGHVDGGIDEFVTIPLDDDNNKISDGWVDNSGGTGDDNDNDPSGDGTNGDQLSRYEEYRGFFIGGSHVRTDPSKKDVFIRDVDSLGPDYFTTSNLGAPVHYMNDNEWEATTRKINFKTDAATISQRIGDQTAIKVLNTTQNVPAGALAATSATGLFVPNNENYCHIAASRITDKATDLRGGIGSTATAIRVWNVTDFRSGAGRFKVDNEIVEYSSISSDAPADSFWFVGCTRGVEGTAAASHANGADVKKWADPNDVVKNTYAHEAGHLVELEDLAGEPANIMDEDVEYGDVKDVHYHNNFGTSINGEFRVKP